MQGEARGGRLNEERNVKKQVFFACIGFFFKFSNSFSLLLLLFFLPPPSSAHGALGGQLRQDPLHPVLHHGLSAVRLLPQQRGLLLPPRSRRGRLLSPDGRRLERLEPRPGCLLLGVLVSGRYPLQGVERLVGARVGPGVMALVLL